MKTRLAGILGTLHIYLKGSNPLQILDYWRGMRWLQRSADRENVLQKDLYKCFSFKFWWHSPNWLRLHRFYFSRNMRGFGEEPFHAAWLEVLTRFRPAHALEIGVYRGQTLSLWQLISERCSIDISVCGISPLTDSGDSVSSYVAIEYELDILTNFRRFNLKEPILVRGYSTDSHAVDFIQSKTWDLIYIDGSHEYEVVVQDYRHAVDNLRPGGVLCLDDSSLYLQTNVDGRFKGHPGPSRVVSELAIRELKHFMTVGHNNFFIKQH